jgi:hypothetical protein
MSGPSGSSLLPADLNSYLAFPRSSVVNRIIESVDQGVELMKVRADGPVALNTFRANRSKWDDHNRDLLRRLFKDDAPRLAYERTGTVPTGPTTPAMETERLRASVEDKLGLLRAILDRLGGSEALRSGGAQGPSSGGKVKAFVAHAGETGLARTVAHYIETQRMSPIIVTGSPGNGEIDFAQIDAYREARYAIILMAGDQIGSSAKRSPNPDAVMWLGYFAGRLGPKRVIALLQPGLEQLGRELGIKNISFDDGAVWKALLSKQITLAEEGSE